MKIAVPISATPSTLTHSIFPFTITNGGICIYRYVEPLSMFFIISPITWTKILIRIIALKSSMRYTIHHCTDISVAVHHNFLYTLKFQVIIYKPRNHIPMISFYWYLNVNIAVIILTCFNLSFVFSMQPWSRITYLDAFIGDGCNDISFIPSFCILSSLSEGQ